MKGYSAFTQTDNDDEYQKKWKSNQNPKTLEKNLKSFEANLKEAIENLQDEHEVMSQVKQIIKTK